MRTVVQTLATPDDPIDPRVDLIELRLDLYPDVNVAPYDKPFIATVRRVEDGGAFDGDESERQVLFARAVGAAYVDIEEGSAPVPTDAKVLTSCHDLQGMRTTNADKVVLTPRDATEALSLLGRGIALGFPFTRFLAPWIYCARTPVIEGMPTPEEVFDLYDVRRLSEHPRIFGVVGDPIAHSRSPRIHNAAFRRAGFDAIYLAFQVADLASFWDAFPGEALSVTAPLKQQAAALATKPDEDVVRTGVANTLFRDGRAMNTDFRAMVAGIPAGTGPGLVVGSGASARTAVVALRDLGYDVSHWARRPDPALAPVAERPFAADVVVNTTPVSVPRGRFHVELSYVGHEAEADLSASAFLKAQAAEQARAFAEVLR